MRHFLLQSLFVTFLSCSMINTALICVLIAFISPSASFKIHDWCTLLTIPISSVTMPTNDCWAITLEATINSRAVLHANIKTFG
jgi:hypothetical protein